MIHHNSDTGQRRCLAEHNTSRSNKTLGRMNLKYRIQIEHLFGPQMNFDVLVVCAEFVSYRIFELDHGRSQDLEVP